MPGEKEKMRLGKGWNISPGSLVSQRHKALRSSSTALGRLGSETGTRRMEGNFIVKRFFTVLILDAQG